jgi:hypothetical protein
MPAEFSSIVRCSVANMEITLNGGAGQTPKFSASEPDTLARTERREKARARLDELVSSGETNLAARIDCVTAQ